MHIAGIVVHANPQRLQNIREAIAALARVVEVHGASAQGKIVLTVEASTAAEILRWIDAIHQIEGVFSAAIVYQHSEDLDSMNEEISYESHAQGIH